MEFEFGDMYAQELYNWHSNSAEPSSTFVTAAPAHDSERLVYRTTIFFKHVQKFLKGIDQKRTMQKSRHCANVTELPLNSSKIPSESGQKLAEIKDSWWRFMYVISEKR